MVSKSVNSAWIAALLLACAGHGTAAPAGMTQSLSVTAKVREHARLRVVSQPTHFDVSEDDLARRYVDVVTPLTLELVSNVARGMQFTFATYGADIRGAQARSTHRATQPRTSGMRQELIEVHLRLELDAGARAGRHAWPVQVTMTPL